MESLPSDVIDHICTFLEIKDAFRLKFTCKTLNSKTKIIIWRSYTCLFNKAKGVPVKGRNCVTFKCHCLLSEYCKIVKEFNSGGFLLLAAVMYSKMSRADIGTRPDCFDEDSSSEDESSYFEPYSGYHLEFIPTTILIKERLSYDIERYMRVVLPGVKPKERLIEYIQKELRFIQEQAWSYPYAHTTKVETNKGDLEEELVMICLDGQILDRSLEVVENLLSKFH